MKWCILFGLVAVAQSISDTISTAKYFCNLPKSTDCSGTLKPLACAFTNSTNIWCMGDVIEIIEQDILSIHNDYRQKIANGDFGKKFGTAARMNELIWDDDLAQLALYNAKRCVYEHDHCIVTKKFNQVGQNIGEQSWYESSISLNERIKMVINDWFAENEECNGSEIESYTPGDGSFRNFLQMINGDTTHIGCGSIFYNDDGYNNTFLACNYASGLVVNQPVYVIGPTGSQCEKASKTYSGLCS